MKLLLIDTDVNFEPIVEAVQPDVDVIYFNRWNSSLDDISNSIIEKGKTYEDIGIIQHSTKNNISLMNLYKEAIIDYGDDVSRVFNKISGWLLLLKEKVGVERFDFFACSIYSNDNVRKLINDLETVTGIDLRASSNDTGNPEEGGDWVMESDGVDVCSKYFTDKIKNFTELLGFHENGPTFNSNVINFDVNGNLITEYTDGLGNYINNLYDSSGNGNNYNFPPCRLIQMKFNPQKKGYDYSIISNIATTSSVMFTYRDSILNNSFISNQSNKILLTYNNLDATQTENSAKLDKFTYQIVNNVKTYLTFIDQDYNAIAVLTYDNVLYVYNRNINNNNIKIENVRNIYYAFRTVYYTKYNSLTLFFIDVGRYQNITTSLSDLTQYKEETENITNMYNGNAESLPTLQTLPNGYISSVIPIRMGRYDSTGYRVGIVLYSNGVIGRIASTTAGKARYCQEIPSTVTINKKTVNSYENVNRVYSSKYGFVVVYNDNTRIGVGFRNDSPGANGFDTYKTGFLNNETAVGNTIPQPIINNRGTVKHCVGSGGAMAIVHDVSVLSLFKTNIEAKGESNWGGNCNPSALYSSDEAVENTNNCTYMPMVNNSLNGDEYVVSVVASQQAFAALTNKGAVFCWGHINSGGYLYNASTKKYYYTNDILKGTSEYGVVKRLYSLSYFFIALLNDGSVYCWGGTTTTSRGGQFLYTKTISGNNIFRAVDVFPLQLCVAITINTGDVIYRYVSIDATLANINTVSATITYVYNVFGQISTKEEESDYNGSLTNLYIDNPKLGTKTICPYYVSPSVKYTMHALQLYQYPSFKKGTCVTGKVVTYYVNKTTGKVESTISTIPIKIENIKKGDEIYMDNNTYKKVKNVIKMNMTLNANVTNQLFYGCPISQYANSFKKVSKLASNNLAYNITCHQSQLIQVKNNIYTCAADNPALFGDTFTAVSEANYEYYQLELEGNPYKNDILITYLDSNTPITPEQAINTPPAISVNGNSGFFMKPYCDYLQYIIDDKIQSIGNKNAYKYYTTPPPVDTNVYRRLNAKYNEYISA